MTAAECVASAKEWRLAAESDNPKRVCYEKCADAIKEALEKDKKLTQTAVAKQIGVSRKWVSDLLLWRKRSVSVRSQTLPFSIDARDRQRRVLKAEQTVPTRRADRVKMAATLMEDEDVVAEAIQTSGRAQASTARAMSADRKESAEASRPRVGRPMEKLAFNVMQKCKEWRGHQLHIAPELPRLDEFPRDKEMVVKGHVALYEVVCDNLDTLGYQYPERRPHLELIEAEEVSEGA